MSYNIRFGGVGREERLAAVIRQADPDIVVLQEATRPDVVERIANLAQLPHWASKSGHSVGFISHDAPSHYEWQYTAHIQRPVMAIDIDGLRIYGVHLTATHSNYTERGRMREVRSLLESVKGTDEQFHVLTGDFNTLAPGELLDLRKLPVPLSHSGLYARRTRKLPSDKDHARQGVCRLLSQSTFRPRVSPFPHGTRTSVSTMSSLHSSTLPA
jgi:exodeoxyribonuclease-3